MTFNDLLIAGGIPPESVLVFRHRPREPRLRRILPWLCAEHPALFNAYQQTQTPKVEAAMMGLEGKGYVASFIGLEPGAAVFSGLYRIRKSKAVNMTAYWKIPVTKQLLQHGMIGPSGDRNSIRWFDLELTDFHSDWKGKLIVDWPPPELAWYRRARNNTFPVRAILTESCFDEAMPAWDEIALSTKELGLLPTRWKAALSHWRGIYYIHDSKDGKGYVGSAYGDENLLGRWLGYGATGHGGNRLLRTRDSATFTFTILQRVSPDMEAVDVIRLEGTWKRRLHTRAPAGLNDN